MLDLTNYELHLLIWGFLKGPDQFTEDRRASSVILCRLQAQCVLIA